MLATAIIVFREVLEAALIISIASAATRAVPGRSRWVIGGVIVGLVLAGVVAAAAGFIAASAEGAGPELFNAGVLLAAVAMLGWHNVWMAQHGREMAAEMKALGAAVQSGARPLYAIGVVVALAVLREGSEVVLFLNGIAHGDSGTAGMLAGSVVGIATGASAGLVLYFGLLSVPVKHFFQVTGWMILLLAAGLASQAAGFLIQADLLPPMGEQLWDSSGLLTVTSVGGQVLHTLIGYDPQPAGAQLLFYVVALVVIGGAMRFVGKTAAAPVAAKA